MSRNLSRRRTRALGTLLCAVWLVCAAAPTRAPAAPVPSQTTAEERSAEVQEEQLAGGDDVQVEVFGVLLLVFVLLMYLWRSRD